MSNTAEIRAILDNLEEHSPSWVKKLRSELASLWEGNASLLSELSSLKARCEAAEARFQRALPTAMYVLRSEAVSAMRLALAQPAEGKS